MHFAPACGTASKARSKPIPGVPRDQQPRPLRSDSFPDGLLYLTDAENKRVTVANISYQATAQLCVMLIKLGVSVSVENPENSLFWKTRHIRQLLAD